MEYPLYLTKDEVLYLETVLARHQDPVEDIGDLSDNIVNKLEYINFDD